ncbi:hypothetical protein GCM10027093_11230 [Paraburkholderia jirisanensis]
MSTERRSEKQPVNVTKKIREQRTAHYGAIADATRQQAVASSWDRAMGNARRAAPTGVKLHPGWDAAFRRVRGG